MYILLSGCPPFNGENEEEIISNVKCGKFDLENESFEIISEEAKFLIKLMLEFDSKKRISALEAVDHLWIKTYAPNNKLDRDLARIILNNLKNFKSDKKLQEVAIAFIVDQFVCKEDIGELRKVFFELDQNNDGKLSYEEIVYGFKNIIDEKNCEKNAREIFDAVDSDKNGYIGYDGNYIFIF